MDKMNKSFLGRGWSFPPQFDNVGAKTKMLSEENDIQSSLEILLSTKRGKESCAQIMDATYMNWYLSR